MSDPFEIGDLFESSVMPDSYFARLGGDQLAYMREFMSEDIKVLFPDAPHIEPGVKLWALLAADGSPIMLADTREAVLANAFENDLKTVSVH